MVDSARTRPLLFILGGKRQHAILYFWFILTGGK
jgi:hypothetical protein